MPELLDIYCIAIGGTGMAPLACLLRDQGHRVRGADGPLYPPMSTVLADAGIEPWVGFDPGHLEASPRPDLVIVGNAVPRTNVEVEAMTRLGLDHLSMPQALARFFLSSRRPLVVAGTHGKTTTTALAAWVYASCGADPGYLIGGLPQNLPSSFRVGSGPCFVIEGDEYNAAYFDRGPKFLHYRPHTLILTSVEHDHADLYPDHESLLAAYRRLVRLVPANGLLAACGDDPQVRAVAAEATCEVIYYGLDEGNDLHPLEGIDGSERSRFRLPRGEDPSADIEISLGVPGEHNVLNSLAVWAAARHEGLPATDVAGALATFEGVQRRLEELGTVRGVTVVDDFAHHPTAVEKSLGGLRQRYPGRRLVALFEPRSLTAGRAFHFDAYLRAFSGADAVIFAPIFYRTRLDEDERLDLGSLVSRLAERGTVCEIATSVDELLARAVAGARDGDVMITMSSGSFDGMPRRLLAALASSAL